jgi:hypothetical protein
MCAAANAALSDIVRRGSLRVVDCVVAQLPLHQGAAARITMLNCPSS